MLQLNSCTQGLLQWVAGFWRRSVVLITLVSLYWDLGIQICDVWQKYLVLLWLGGCCPILGPSQVWWLWGPWQREVLWIDGQSQRNEDGLEDPLKDQGFGECFHHLCNHGWIIYPWKAWFPQLEARELPDVPRTGYQLNWILEEPMSASPDWFIHENGENPHLQEAFSCCFAVPLGVSTSTATLCP